MFASLHAATAGAVAASRLLKGVSQEGQSEMESEGGSRGQRLEKKEGGGPSFVGVSQQQLASGGADLEAPQQLLRECVRQGRRSSGEKRRMFANGLLTAATPDLLSALVCLVGRTFRDGAAAGGGDGSSPFSWTQQQLLQDAFFVLAVLAEHADDVAVALLELLLEAEGEQEAERAGGRRPPSADWALLISRLVSAARGGRVETQDEKRVCRAVCMCMGCTYTYPRECVAHAVRGAANGARGVCRWTGSLSASFGFV